jgi:hypothetical protein
MPNRIVYCFCTVVIFMFVFVGAVTAENDFTDKGNVVHELQVVYPISASYVSDFGIGVQGKYYLSDNFYLGWYTPLRTIFPFEQKRQGAAKTEYDIQAKLMGSVGCTFNTALFAFDTSVLAGWRYWYTKTTIHNNTYNINGSYDSSTTSFEWGLMATARWKLGKTFGFENQLYNLNFDFYGYLPMTEGIENCLAGSELAFGLSYTY